MLKRNSYILDYIRTGKVPNYLPEMTVMQRRKKLVFISLLISTSYLFIIFIQFSISFKIDTDLTTYLLSTCCTYN